MTWMRNAAAIYVSLWRIALDGDTAAEQFAARLIIICSHAACIALVVSVLLLITDVT